MKYYLLYETLNLANGKRYVGQHCTRDLYDGYFGSNEDLKNDVERGNKIRVIILKHCRDIFELGDLEYEEIEKVKAYNNDKYYNKHITRFYNKCFEYGHTENTKKKIAKALKGKKKPARTKEHKDNLSKSLKGRILSEDHKRKIGDAQQKQTEEARFKMGSGKRGKKRQPDGSWFLE